MPGSCDHRRAFPPAPDDEVAASTAKLRTGFAEGIARWKQRLHGFVTGNRVGVELGEFLPTFAPGLVGRPRMGWCRLAPDPGRATQVQPDLSDPQFRRQQDGRLLLLCVAVPVSVWFGRRIQLAGPSRRVLLLSHAALALVALLAFGDMETPHAKPDDYAAGSEYGGPGPNYQPAAMSSGLVENGQQVTNLFVYDKAGEAPRRRLHLDQNGSPVEVGDAGNEVFRPNDRDPNGPVVYYSVTGNGQIGLIKGIYQSHLLADGQGFEVANLYRNTRSISCRRGTASAPSPFPG